MALNNLAPYGMLSMSMVKGSLFNEETRRKCMNYASHSKALITKNRGINQSKNFQNCDKEPSLEEGQGGM